MKRKKLKNRREFLAKLRNKAFAYKELAFTHHELAKAPAPSAHYSPAEMSAGHKKAKKSALEKHDRYLKLLSRYSR